MLEIITTDDKLREAVDVIKTAAHTGEIGDGKIIVTDITNIISIRTGQENESAL